MTSLRVVAGVLCSLWLSIAAAGDGPLGIDKRLGVDNDGLWSRRSQHVMLGALITSEVVAGVWAGESTRFGRTSWQSIDAMLLSAATTEVMKRTFRRVRPSNTEPLLRLNVEAGDRATMERLRDEALGLIRNAN